MNRTNLYLYQNTKSKKIFFHQDDYIQYMKLLKVLFRLDIIDEDTTISVAMEFRPFFV